MSNPFEDWGTTQSKKGITYTRKSTGQTTERVKYDKRVKPKYQKAERNFEMGQKPKEEFYTEPQYKYDKRVKPKSLRSKDKNITYGQQHESKTISATFGKDSGIEIKTAEQQLKEKREATHKWAEAEASRQKLEINQMQKEADEAVKAEKKRVKAREKEFDKKSKANARAKVARAKRWKNVRFTRKTPLAKAIRRKLRL